jgi:hypothetical protein
MERTLKSYLRLERGDEQMASPVQQQLTVAVHAAAVHAAAMPQHYSVLPS